MGKMKDLAITISDIAIEISELDSESIEYLAAVLAERRAGKAQELLAALQVNLHERLADNRNPFRMERIAKWAGY